MCNVNRSNISDFVVAENGQCGGAGLARSIEGDLAAAVIDDGRAHDFVVACECGACTIAVGGGYAECG